MAHDALRRKILTGLAILPFSGKLIAKNLTTGTLHRTGSEVAPPEMALNSVRFFNTMEAWHKLKFKTYVSKPELQDWEVLQKTLNHLPKIRGGAQGGLPSLVNVDAEDLLPGWRLRLHVSPQRDDYLITMGSEEMIIASGDPGIIYYGGPKGRD